jgi:SAM-dependent methyltransferase
VLDASPAQLAQDRLVADREGLTIRTVNGDMADLSAFQGGQFQMVFHPCSNCFVPAVRPVWQEAFRVLRPGGVLLAGFSNPVLFLFDDLRVEQGELVVRHAVPYADHTSLTEEECRRFIDKDEPLVFGHTLEEQIGGQLDAGFVLTGLYEDHDPTHPLSKFLPGFIATRAVKTASPTLGGQSVQE